MQGVMERARKAEEGEEGVEGTRPNEETGGDRLRGRKS
jgi:hypothetical protein